MELVTLQSLLGNYEELQKQVVAEKVSVDIANLQKQYEPTTHDITDKTKRPDKIVTTDQSTSTVLVARLPVAFQKVIVKRAAAFLCGNPIELVATPATDLDKALLAALKKTWEDNKLDYDSKALASLMMKETEVAELWYTEQVDPIYWIGTPMEGSGFRLRMKIIANEKGDGLYPVFNAAGDMIAFGRSYIINVADKKEEHFDLYTDTQIILGIKGDSGWATTSLANPIGKIPVIYYSQPQVEWSDVQELINRFEVAISNHADTVDYFGSPMVKVKGTVKGFAKKGEQGKVLELEDGADADYLSWDQSPESVKLELNTLRSLIFDLTDTPDISIEQMKALGTYSGIALKMLFLGAHLKAADKEETFGKSIQRRINYLKSALAIINLKLQPSVPLAIKPKFEYYLPKNDTEKIDMLATATGNKPIVSRKTAVALNPLVQDPETEMANLEEEDSAGLDTQFNT